MRGFFNLFKRSALEFKSIRCLTATAMLIALNLATKVAATYQITAFLKVSFGFLTLAAVGMLFGPTVAFVAGTITDILGFIIVPSGAFDIRFTFIEALGAAIYGVFLYNAENNRWLLPRVIAAKSAVTIICNLWLTTWATMSLAGKGFLALLPTRAIKNAAELPLQILLLMIVLPAVLKICQAVGFRRQVDEKLLFCDQNVGKAMIVMITIVMIIVCAVGYAEKFLDDERKDLKSRLKEDEAKIAQLDGEIEELYKALGLERPEIAENE